MREKTSKYRGVYYNTPSGRWVVELERHDQYPYFHYEYDAAIYAEYHYRILYGESPNFPDMDDTELKMVYEQALRDREFIQAEIRSSSKQGLRKRKENTSKYVGVCKKDGTRWVARIQYKGKQLYIASFSVYRENAELEAAKAYDKKAAELYGDSARLNFPEQSVK